MDTYDNISIVEIVFYSFFLVGGVYLCFKHGIGKGGWRYHVILSLVRLIGSAFCLRTISDTTNTSLYIGWQTLNGVGLGPLVLIVFGLIGRLFDSINRRGYVIVKPLYQHLIEALMLASMVLIIVGGVESDHKLVNGKAIIDYSTLSRVGIILMIIVVVLICLEFFIALRSQGYVPQGEHRILIAIGVSLPFIIVRLVYSCVTVLGSSVGSVGLFLGAGVIMEIVVVLVCEVVGFMLDKAPPKTKTTESPDHEAQFQPWSAQDGASAQPQRGAF